VTEVVSPLLAVVWRDPLGVCYTLGRRYQPEMSEVTEILKAWKQECEEQVRRLEQQREEQSIE